MPVGLHLVGNSKSLNDDDQENHMKKFCAYKMHMAILCGWIDRESDKTERPIRQVHYCRNKRVGTWITLIDRSRMVRKSKDDRAS